MAVVGKTREGLIDEQFELFGRFQVLVALEDEKLATGYIVLGKGDTGSPYGEARLL